MLERDGNLPSSQEAESTLDPLLQLSYDIHKAISPYMTAAVIVGNNALALRHAGPAYEGLTRLQSALYSKAVAIVVLMTDGIEAGEYSVPTTLGPEDRNNLALALTTGNTGLLDLLLSDETVRRSLGDEKVVQLRREVLEQKRLEDKRSNTLGLYTNVDTDYGSK